MEMLFLGIFSIQCKSGAINQVTCDNRPVDTIDLLVPLGLFQYNLHFFWLQFLTFFLKFYAVNLCQKQFGFVVFVSCIVLPYFML